MIAGADEEETDVGWAAGAAYIFRREGTTWVLEARLTGSDPVESGHFGSPVALDGDRAIVGAHSWGDGCGGATPCERLGAAYIFRREGTNWIEEARVSLDSPKEDDWRFGASVDLRGDVAVVGGHLDSGYVYRFGAAGWSLEAIVSEEADVALGDYVAKALVRTDGSNLLLFSDWIEPAEPGINRHRTSLAVYHGDRGRWTRVQSLEPSGDELRAYTLGTPTAIGGGVVAVGDKTSQDESVFVFAITASGGSIPTVSAWGAVALSLLLMIAATTRVMRRGTVPRRIVRRRASRFSRGAGTGRIG